MSRVAAHKAMRAGHSAKRAGLAVTACPHDPDGDMTQRFLTRYWIRGWNRGLD